MKLDTVFAVLLTALIFGSIPQVYVSKAYITRRQLESGSYPRLYDLWQCIFIALLLTILRLALTPLLRVLAKRLILQDSLGSNIRELKVARFCSMVLKTGYFVGISMYALVKLKEYEWFPEELGGSGKSELFWIGYPLQENNGFLRTYFFINGGFQLCNLIFLLTEPQMPDFSETLLQSICAIFLIGFAYMSNFLRIGSVIMFCHDFCDIFSCGCKAVVDTSLKPLTLSLFLCLVSSWGYLRLYCFPGCLHSILHESHVFISNLEHEGFLWFICLLLTQLLMNFYWFLLMIKMFWHFLSSGQTVDMHSPVTSLPSQKTVS